MLERLRQWFADEGPADLEEAVDIDQQTTAYGEQNRVSIDHRLPEPGGSDRWRFRVTTRSQFLPKTHIDRAVRSKVNEASDSRGRRIYAVERESMEVVAVLSYHLDERKARPLLITALGTRCDDDGSPELFSLSNYPKTRLGGRSYDSLS